MSIKATPEEIERAEKLFPLNAKTSYQKFVEVEIEEPLLKNESAFERLRFFCSLAMSSQDWIDSERFFDDREKDLKKLSINTAEK